MTACTISPANLERQIRVVGRDLVEHYGKKIHYTMLEVRNANRRTSIHGDYACWSYAFFNDRADFDAYHAARGELCDYAAMRIEIASTLGAAGRSSSRRDGRSSSRDFDDSSWLDVLDFDWPSSFGFDFDPS